MADVRALSVLAGVELDKEVSQAVEAGYAGSAVRSALRSGKDAFTRHMAEQFFAQQNGGNPELAILQAALVLVAEHSERGIVGALVAYPPVSVISQFMNAAAQHSRDPQGPLKALLSGSTCLMRIKAIAVHSSERQNGIGRALIGRCQQIYAHCGYFIIYGQMPPTPGSSLSTGSVASPCSSLAKASIRG